jgi:transposase-like protein
MDRYICDDCGYVFTVENYEPDYADDPDDISSGAVECPRCGSQECSLNDFED